MIQGTRRCNALHVVAAMNGKIYIAGGIKTTWPSCTRISSCAVYNPAAANEWQLMPNLKVPRHSASMVHFHICCVCSLTY